MSISWHKTSKTQHLMNHWSFGSVKPVFLHFITQNYLKKSRKNQGASLEKMETSATVPLGSSGVFDPPGQFPVFSDVLMSCFLSLKGAHSPTDGFPCMARSPLFTLFLCLFFRPPFWQRLSPKALKMRAPKQLKIRKNCKKNSPKHTHSQDL